MHKYPYQHPRNYDYVNAMVNEEFGKLIKKYGRTKSRMIKTGEHSATNIFLLAATMKVMGMSAKDVIKERQF